MHPLEIYTFILRKVISVWEVLRHEDTTSNTQNTQFGQRNATETFSELKNIKFIIYPSRRNEHRITDLPMGRRTYVPVDTPSHRDGRTRLNREDKVGDKK